MNTPVIPPSPSREEYARDYAAALAANSAEADFACEEPFALLERWLADARAHEINDSNAMALATVDADGLPDCRTVLLKDVSPDGLTFYSNRESDKGRQLDGQPHAALLFHWKSLRRQVRVRGPVERVSDMEADAYFATRHRVSQLGAHASAQSRPLPARAVLAERVEQLSHDLGDDPIPRPAHWSGFRIKPQQLEFWHDRPFRLHDRLRFDQAGDTWEKTRLYP
jgi:pyridoxamine 5'-phosphate oxidase